MPSWLKIIRNEADATAPVEMMIFDKIGKDFYGDDGVDVKDFNESLKTIPKGSPINLRMNCPGGNMWDGIAIGDMLAARGNVTCTIEGLAASIGSYIAMSCSKTVMTKHSMMMIHRASSYAAGNADDMARMKDRLEAHDETLAKFYAEKTGKGVTECRNLMADETWMDGEDAAKEGFVDEVIDADTIIKNFDLSRFRNVPKALNKTGSPNGETATENHNKENTMNRQKIIAMLKKHGVEVAENATDDALHTQLETVLNAAKPEPKPEPKPADNIISASELAAVKAELTRIKQQEEDARRSVILAAVEAAIADDKIPAGQKDRWVTRAMADKTVLDDLKSLPSRPPGTAPVSNIVEVTGASFENIEAGFNQQRAAVKAYMRGNDVNAIEVHRGAKAIASIVAQLRKRFPDDGTGLVCAPILNANTISTDLKRQVIMANALRDFKRVIYPLSRFSTKFERVPLQGLDTVIVPYYPLITTASVDFVAANGYDTPLATSTNSKTLTINKRKYQMLNFTASEISRQPWLDIQKLSAIAAEQLAIDVFQDFNSLFLAADYTNVAYTGPFAGFDRNSVVDIRTAISKLNWPQGLRNLMLNFDYSGNLLKDPGLVNVLNVGTDQALRAANLGQMFGFNAIDESNYIPQNGEHLMGYAVHPAAAIFATAPILPAPNERLQMGFYDVITDEQTDVSFEYKAFGNPQMSRDSYIIECNYGYGKANTAALARIISQ